jgi:hypothetical protein
MRPLPALLGSVLFLLLFLPTIGGVYAILLELPGHKPRFYVGSGMAWDMGVRKRLYIYRNPHTHDCVSENIRKAWADGFTITHVALLAHCPSPEADVYTPVQYLVLALEATFSCAM